MVKHHILGHRLSGGMSNETWLKLNQAYMSTNKHLDRTDLAKKSSLVKAWYNGDQFDDVFSTSVVVVTIESCTSLVNGRKSRAVYHITTLTAPESLSIIPDLMSLSFTSTILLNMKACYLLYINFEYSFIYHLDHKSVLTQRASFKLFHQSWSNQKDIRSSLRISESTRKNDYNTLHYCLFQSRS